jgi:predicted DNA-binding transcriptional regulator AlpA
VQDEDQEVTGTGHVLMTFDELLDKTGWGRTATYQKARRDELPFRTLRCGRKLYFSRSAFERWLAGEHKDAD